MAISNSGLIAQMGKKAILGDGQGTTLFQKWKQKYDDNKIPRVDENLPLGIKLGSLVELDLLSDFTLGEDDFLIPEFEGKGEVYAFGKIEVSSSLKVYRFYVRSMNYENFEDYFLEVGTKNGEVLSTILYVLYQELDVVESYNDVVTPDGKAALNYWLGEDNPLIGGIDFSIHLEEGQKVDYIRMDSPNDNRVITTEEKEVIYDEPKDQDLEHITNIVGEYARAVESTAFGGKEFLIVRASESQSTASIQIFIGVEISKTQIKVI